MRIILIIVFLTNIAVCMGQNSHFVDSEYSTIHFKTFGQGSPVLIINGGPGFNSEGFSTLAKAIEDLGYQAILFDQRGTGQSKLEKIDSSTITMDLMVKDIEQIRKDLKFSEWIVLGHSFGGILANYYTSKHPEKVKALIQSSSGGIDLSLLETAQSDINSKFTQDEIDSLQFWRQQYRTSDRPDARKKYNQLFAKAYVYHKKHIPLIANRLMEGDLEINGLVWDNLINIEYDCKNDLGDFCNPVLIIQGKQDIISQQLAYKADSVYCNSRIVFLDHCAHYGWVDQKEKYLEEIKRFLSLVNTKTCREKEISPIQFGENVFEEQVFKGTLSPVDSTFYFFEKMEQSQQQRIYDLWGGSGEHKLWAFK